MIGEVCGEYYSGPALFKMLRMTEWHGNSECARRKHGHCTRHRHFSTGTKHETQTSTVSFLLLLVVVTTSLPLPVVRCGCCIFYGGLVFHAGSVRCWRVARSCSLPLLQLLFRTKRIPASVRASQSWQLNSNAIKHTLA